MKRLFIAFLIAVGVYGLLQLYPEIVPPFSEHRVQTGLSIEDAFRNRRNNVHVEGSGEVVQILRDDTRGSRHQRFIVRLPSGLTLLVVHNIDIAPRIEGLKKGASIEFSGEYEWNSKGGILHWTHHDPHGRHRGGWIKYRGRKYD